MHRMDYLDAVSVGKLVHAPLRHKKKFTLPYHALPAFRAIDYHPGIGVLWHISTAQLRYLGDSIIYIRDCPVLCSLDLICSLK